MSSGFVARISQRFVEAPFFRHRLSRKLLGSGGETEKMLELARAFNAPIVTILVNGGAIAANEALHSIRNDWPLLVFEGAELSGQL